MQQIYHANARTNINIREQIQKNSSVSNQQLAHQFATSTQTISKWKHRSFVRDASCTPHTIHYALSPVQQALVISIRQSTWFSLNEVHQMVSENDDSITRSSVYRCFVRNGLNKIPEKEKEKSKKFKEYEPGFLHIDVTYLPKIKGIKYYLFVAIDRATRILFYAVYEDKTALSAQHFFNQCKDFFPFQITHILTDNGLEFTNKLLKSKTKKPCEKISLFDHKCLENNIKHRLTLPKKPQTNGMVERVNGIIKSHTVAKIDFENSQQLKLELSKFLVHYNLERRHGSLKQELNVKTPFNALEKWFQIKPEIFSIYPIEFKNNILNLNKIYSTPHQQPCET